jgi:endonuclease/exonuclease/phosphatase family metal-dependent hydrolase
MLYILTPAKSPIMNRRRLLSTLIFVLTALLLLRVSSAGSAPSSLVSKKTLRIMTYNIHVGVGMDKKLDLKRIADVINRENPDLVGLQEVDRGVKRTEEKDEIAELAKLTRMDFSFAPNLDYQGGQYGVAILSRHLIQKADHQKYENKRETERRGMLRVEVEIDGKKLNFVTTHLDYQFEDGRLFETEQLLTRFEDAWIGSKAKGEGLTFPANQPVKRIDYIFTRATDRIRVKKAWVIDSLASDHLPLMAEVEIR